MEASRTETETETTLQLHLQPPRPAVRWAEDVIDNEDMNKKKSKSTPYTVSLLSIHRSQKAHS